MKCYFENKMNLEMDSVADAVRYCDATGSTYFVLEGNRYGITQEDAVCPSCNGMGWDRGYIVECSECNGFGTIGTKSVVSDPIALHEIDTYWVEEWDDSYGVIPNVLSSNANSEVWHTHKSISFMCPCGHNEYINANGGEYIHVCN